MMGLCVSEGIGRIPWSPLARGRLARGGNPSTPSIFDTDKFGPLFYAQTQGWQK